MGADEGAGRGADGLTVADVRRRAVSGSVLLVGRGIALQGLGLVSTIVIARFFAPGELGEVAFGLTLTTLFFFVGGSQGLVGALVRRQEPVVREDLETVLALQLAIGLAIAGATTVAGLQLGHVGRLTAVMAWAIPAAAFRAPAQAVLERRLAYRQIVSAEVAEVLVFQAWQIGTVVAGWGVWGLATAVICRSVGGTVVLLAVSDVRCLTPRLDRRRARSLLGLGLRIQTMELVASVRDQGLNLSAAAVGGLPVLGLWSMAYRALQPPLTIFSSLFRVSLPATSRLLSLGKDAKPLVEEALELVAPACGLLLVPLTASSPALFSVVLGRRWAGAAAVLPPATLGLMVGMPVLLAGVGYLWAVGDGTTPLRAAILDTAAWFGTALPLLPVLGVRALGLGMLAGTLAQTFVIARGVRRRIGIAFARPVLVPAAIAAAAAVPPWLAAAARPATFGVLVAAAAAAEGLYVVGLVLFHRRVTVALGRLALRPLAARAAARAVAVTR